MDDPVITVEDFRQFREFFYRKTGIYFDDNKRYFVDRRLIDRINATTHANFRRYFWFLRFQASGDELQKLTNAMTVNETYFFREDYQFQCLSRSILPEIVKTKRRGSTIRIWCVPSSSGEEPYSIALHLLECWPDIDQWNVEITASDIDTDILAAAVKASFSKRSVQNVPAPMLAKYFSRSEADEYQLCDDVRHAIDFTHVNIVNGDETRAYRGFDIIFCRNLLIYFDDLSRRQAAEMFFDALNPGGYICLGHSESMSRISSIFRIRKFPETIAYQKPEET
ncbi:MAG: protein-glutamate O-methyltransferase CheR [Proteobacteria bacterium]|nr:protein-glutamate O-methyltransferase CheR [Pseudomonadota bacterium]